MARLPFDIAIISHSQLKMSKRAARSLLALPQELVSETRCYVHLSGSIATVNDDIGTSGVGAGIAGEVDVGTLELGGFGVTAEGNHAVPQILNLLVNEVRETGVNVAGRDGVDAGEVAPFVGERACQVDAAGFGNVVGCLEERNDVSVGTLHGCNCEGGGTIIPVLGGSWRCGRTWKQ